MSRAIDYRNSHTTPGKGQSYDRDFQERKLRRYIWSWEQDVLRDILQRFFPDAGSVRYLDFACGTGRILGFLEGQVSRSCGVDVSETMLEVARQRVKKSILINADITANDPLEGERFDLITAFRFFLNAQPRLRQQVMTTLAGRLQPKGCLVFNVHMNHSCLLAKLVRTKRRLLRRDPRAFTTLSHQQVQCLTADAGLRIVRTYHRGIIPLVNENTIVPLWVIQPVEAPASRIPLLRSWARYVVYVCQPDSE